MIESAESALLAITQRNVIETHRQQNITNQVLHEEEEGGHSDSPASYFSDQDIPRDGSPHRQSTSSDTSPE
jgi:hypothetical protein